MREEVEGERERVEEEEEEKDLDQPQVPSVHGGPRLFPFLSLFLPLCFPLFLYLASFFFFFSVLHFFFFSPTMVKLVTSSFNFFSGGTNPGLTRLNDSLQFGFFFFFYK